VDRGGGEGKNYNQENIEYKKVHEMKKPIERKGGGEVFRSSTSQAKIDGKSFISDSQEANGKKKPRR